MSLSIKAVAALFGTLIATFSAEASTCDAAAQKAGSRHGVPTHMLRALARVETGRTIEGAFQPWPWAINLDGQGTWFSSRAAASAYLHGAQAQGIRNFDVGCFQINNLWHGQAFGGIDDMLDPARNADYAARFLKSLFEETGSWDTAVGYFHSRTPEKAARYKARFDTVLARLSAEPEHLITRVAKVRPNAFPLLQGVGSASGASLVPLSPGGVDFFSSAQPLLGSHE